MTDVQFITSAMLNITSRGFDPHTSSWEHKVCVMLHAAQGIIDNGGFEYFFDSEFEDDPDMEDFPRVFESVGATESAGTLREALLRAKNPPANYDDLNERMWNRSEQNFALLRQYIMSHEGSFG